VYGKKKAGESDLSGYISIEDELARVMLVSPRSSKYEWKAAGQSGVSYTEDGAMKSAKAALRSAGNC